MDQEDRGPFCEAADSNGKLHAEFDVASNPEFLQEGRAIENIFHPDRVVVGVESERARALLEQLYQPLGCRSCLRTSARRS